MRAAGRAVPPPALNHLERAMKQYGQYLGALALAMTIFSALTFAQAPQGAPPQGAGGGRGGAPQPMTFFVTSVGKGDGANYGGLAGADAYCQQLAAAVGRGDGVTWRAYLSTQGPGAVNARDRIGNGPWFNQKGQQIAASVAELHGDTLEQARLGNRITKTSALNEKGQPVNGVGDMPNQHDILTGSQPDGRAFTDGADHTCNNYTANTNVEAPARGQGAPAGGGGAAAGAARGPAPAPGPSVMLGHHDRLGGGSASWNAAHGSRGCSQPNLVATGGAGLLYCFAAN
jgi:hypothetical protein